MKTLRKRVIWLFVAVELPMSFLISQLDCLLDWGTHSVTDEGWLSLMLAGYLLAQLIVFALATLLFSRWIGRLVAKENARYAHGKSMLIADIAHDLKTPLTSVIGFSQALLEGKAKDEAERREMLELVHKKAVRANELLERMFLLVLLDGEDVPMRLERANACAVVREVVAMHYQEFEDSGIRLEVDVPDAPVMALLDAREFGRALTNLLVNAYRYNEAGSAALVRLENKGRQVKVSVADTGEPIPTNDVQHIFEPFVRGDASRTGDGSGLGLAIASRILCKHKGKLAIEVGIQGYTKAFVIELPAA